MTPGGRKEAMALAETIMRNPEEWTRSMVLLAGALTKRWHDDPAPWVPMKEPIAVKHLSKLIEELGEATSAAARCLMQGIDEAEPSTGKPNREWLAEELADVLCNANLVIEHFRLDGFLMTERMNKKQAHLRRWHSMEPHPSSYRTDADDL